MLIFKEGIDMEKKFKKAKKITTQEEISSDFKKAFKIAQQLSSPTLFSKQDKKEIIDTLIEKVCN